MVMLLKPWLHFLRRRHSSFKKKKKMKLASKPSCCKRRVSASVAGDEDLRSNSSRREDKIRTEKSSDVFATKNCVSNSVQSLSFTLGSCNSVKKRKRISEEGVCDLSVDRDSSVVPEVIQHASKQGGAKSTRKRSRLEALSKPIEEESSERAADSGVTPNGKHSSTEKTVEERRTQPCLQGFSEHEIANLTNLDIVRALRASNVPLHRKVELCTRYVELQRSQTSQGFLVERSIPLKQFVLFLFEWIQSTLVASSRQEVTQSVMGKLGASVLGQSERDVVLPAFLDTRCWDILSWCLSSGYMGNGISMFSRLLHPITALLKVVTSFYKRSTTLQTECSFLRSPENLKDESIPSVVFLFGAGSKIISSSVVLLRHSSDVLSVVLSSHGQSFRPSLEEWTSLVLRALDCITLVCQKEVLSASQILDDALQRSGMVALQGFLRFLVSYPNQKLIFQTIVERLLEALLDVFGRLSLRFEDAVLPMDQSQCLQENHELVGIVEKLLENSLFHTAHADGFSEVCSFGIFTNYNAIDSTEVGNHKLDNSSMLAFKKESVGLNIPQSYQRLFFLRVTQLIKDNKFSALRSLGWLLRMYARKVKTKQDTRELIPSSHSILERQEITIERKPDVGESEDGVEQLWQTKITHPSESLFNVFAELLLPLKTEIQNLTVSVEDSEITSKLLKTRALLVAANGLLSAARDQNVYVPVEDTPTNSHMQFIKEFHQIMMHIGGFVINMEFSTLGLPKTACARKIIKSTESTLSNINSNVTSFLHAEILDEVVDALLHLFELEYKVFEDHLICTWLLIFSRLSLWYMLQDEKSYAVNIQRAERRSADFGGRILHIFSALRKVQLPLHFLFELLRSLLHPKKLSFNLALMFSMLDDSKKEQAMVGDTYSLSTQKAIGRVLCAKSFLQKVAESMVALPEGQIAEFVDMLAVDIKEVLKALDDFGKDLGCQHSITSSNLAHGTSAVEALAIILTSILDNINVTATNSFQVGVSVRNLVDITITSTQVLSELAYVASKQKLTGYNISHKVSTFPARHAKQKDTFSMGGASLDIEELGDESLLRTPFKLLLVLRVYLACRSLHRQCVTLMSPKKAKQACALVHEPVLSGNHWLRIVTELSQESFFSWIEGTRGSFPKVFDFCIYLERTFQSWIEQVPSIVYIMDRMRMLRVADIDRYINAVKFIKEMIQFESACLDENDPLMGSASHEILEGLEGIGYEADVSSTLVVDALLAAYKDEAVLLASSWVDDVLGCMEKSLNPNIVESDAICCSRVSTSEMLGIFERIQSVDEVVRTGIFPDTTCHRICGQFECNHCQKAMLTLTESLLLLARWSLLSSSIDLWSKYIKDGTRESFINFIFQFYRLSKGRNHVDSKEESHNAVCFTRSGSMFNLQFGRSPMELFRSLSFYEEQSFRHLVALYFCEQLKLVVDQGYRDSGRPLTADTICGEGQSSLHFERIGEMIDLNNPAAEKITQGFSRYIPTESVVKSFSHCRHMVNILTLFPCGYLHKDDVSMCLDAIISLERFLLENMLSYNFAQTTGGLSFSESMWRHLKLFGDCRQALESLLLSISQVQLSAEMSMLPFNFDALRWFPISLRLATGCVYHINKTSDQHIPSDKEDVSGRYCWKDFLDNIYESSKNASFYASKSILLSASTSFLHLGVQESVRFDLEKLEGVKHSERAEKSCSLATLSKFFLNETLALENLLKEVESKIPCAQRKMPREPSSPTVQQLDSNDASSGKKQCWYEAISSIGIINSFLWSVVTVVEDLDRYCHLHNTMNWTWSFKNSSLKPLHGLEVVLTRLLLDIIRPFQLEVAINGFVKNDTLEHMEKPACDENDDADHLFSQEKLLRMTTRADFNGKRLNENGFNFLELHLSFDKIFRTMSDRQLKFFGELLMSLAAIVKIRSLFHSSYAMSSDENFRDKQMPSSISVLLGLAYHFMLSNSFWEDKGTVENLMLLFGSIRCMESFGSLLPFMKPLLSSLSFLKLVNVHIHMLSRILPFASSSHNCNVPFLSHSTHSFARAKIFEPNHIDEKVHVIGVEDFDKLRVAIKASFGALVRDAPRQHLILALQAIERASLNIWDGFERGCGLDFSISVSGTVPRVVASGIDCFGITLEAVSGRRRLQLLAKHCPKLLAAVFNLLEHLKGRTLFEPQKEKDYIVLENNVEGRTSHLGNLKTIHLPYIVLESLRIITRVSSRPTIFPMKASHVALSLHCPTSLLKEFCVSGTVPSNLQHKKQHVMKPDFLTARSRYLVHLFIASCKLLSALVRHRRRESGHCVALLGESIHVLLCWLESKGSLVARQNSNTDDVLECAHWLQRLYEEVGAQKDSFGRYSCHLLSDYLSVLCGHGPQAEGLNRDVEMALRPGVFALLDASSSMDLQQLHVTLGEGPERDSLTTLRHDYEKHYRYRGKV